MRPPYERVDKPNGKVMIRVVIGYEARKPKRVSKTFPPGTPDSTLYAWALAAKSDNEHEPRKPGRRPHPDKVIDAWLDSKRGVVSSRTIDNYEAYTRLYIRGRLKAFDKASVNELLSSLRRADGGFLSPKTRDTARTLLKGILTFAEDEGFVEQAPKLLPSGAVKRHKSIHVLDRHEVVLLSLHLSEHNELALETLLTTGVRISELLALQPRHLLRTSIRVEQSLASRWGKRVAAPPKSASAYRTLAIPSRLRYRLKRHVDRLPDGERFMFQTGPSGLAKRLQRACSEIDVPYVGLHGLRHTHCTFLLSRGVSVVAVSRRLGHHSPAFTLRTYAHLIPDMDEKLDRVLLAIEDAKDLERVPFEARQKDSKAEVDAVDELSATLPEAEQQ